MSREVLPEDLDFSVEAMVSAVERRPGRLRRGHRWLVLRRTTKRGTIVVRSCSSRDLAEAIAKEHPGDWVTEIGSR
jgi:hypothetical protein